MSTEVAPGGEITKVKKVKKVVKKSTGKGDGVTFDTTTTVTTETLQSENINNNNGNADLPPHEDIKR
jgi:hypothetical protein